MIQQSLGKPMKIEGVDGRVYFGTIECFDKQGNIYMLSTIERTINSSGDVVERILGGTCFPKDQVKALYVEESL